MATRVRPVTTTVLLALLFVVGVVLGLQCRTGGEADRDKSPSQSAGTSDTSLSTSALELSRGHPAVPSFGFADVAARVAPAVVNVSSERVVVTRDRVRSPFGWDPFFDFFGPRYFSIPRHRRETSLGSGVIVSASGVVLTNNHVVEGAQEVQVLLADGRRLHADLLGSDPATDVAVLKVDASGLPTVPIGNSDSSRIGDVVLAFGNPFGIGQTVTMGIISATGRSELGLVDYENFIQTDAAINPGNSGGALVDVAGRLIGINTAIFSRTGGYQGIGFAIPINIAEAVMHSILTAGKVIRGWLGVNFQDIDAAMADAFGLTDTHGALISEVTPDGPADRAGLQRGDVIVEFNGHPVVDAVDLRRLVALSPVGQEVGVAFMRGRERDETQVKVAEQQTEFTYSRGDSGGPASPLAGIVVEELDSHAAARLGLRKQTHGVVIKEILPQSPAARSGLQPGDAILEINRRPIEGVESFKSVLAQIEGRPVVLLLSRGGELYYLSLPS